MWTCSSTILQNFHLTIFGNTIRVQLNIIIAKYGILRKRINNYGHSLIEIQILVIVISIVNVTLSFILT